MSLAIACIIAIVAAATCDRKSSDSQTIIHYLQRYGYLDRDSQSLASLNETQNLHHAIALFQEYYRLPGNGKLNNITLTLMRQPRCGVEDISPERTAGSLSSKWPKSHLKWNFHLASEEILRTTRAAFDLWAEHSSLTFERDTLHPDILISFREGIHLNVDFKNGETCSGTLDGPGGTLAHAFFPTGKRDDVSEVHVDGAEPWHIHLTENPSERYSLLYTLTHEIGHSLGIPHSQRQDSIMFAFQPAKSFPVRLSKEDVLSIQNLYGVKDKSLTSTTEPSTTEPSTTEPSTTEPSTTTTRSAPPDLCALRYIDALLILDSRTYIAYKRFAWSVDVEGRIRDKPLLLTDYMSFLPQNFTRLTAAYQRPSGDLVLFANKQIYLVKYPSYELLPSWPRSYSDLGIPTSARINAALSTNAGRIFVIYDNYGVAELNDCTMKVVRHYAIQTIFPGIPPDITTAFRFIDGNLYFIGKGQFYVFNEFTKSVELAGKFDLRILNVVCPTTGILQQLRDLLNHLARIGNVYEKENEEE